MIVFFYLSRARIQFGQAKFRVFNLSLRASVAQQELDIVDQMWVEFRMGSWGFTMFWGGFILGDYRYIFHSGSGSPLINKCNGRLGLLWLIFTISGQKKGLSP